MKVVVDWSAFVPEEQVDNIELQLVSDGRSGLVSLLERLRGYGLPGGYMLDKPLAAGGQGVVFAGRNCVERCVAVKLPLLDFHRPWSYGQGRIELLRSLLSREADLLREHSPSLSALPSFVALIWAANPLHEPSRDLCEIGPDPFLIMELVEGTPLHILAGRWRAGEVPGFDLATFLRRALSRLVQTLEALSELGLFYVDMKPEHLVVTPDMSALRLLDAAGFYSKDDKGSLPMAMTPAYGTSDIIRPERVARLCLARTLHEVWTGRRPTTSDNPLTWRDAPPWLAEAAELLESEEALSWSGIRKHLVDS